MMPEVKFLVKENKVVKKNALKINTKCFLFFLFEKLTLEIINCIGTFGGKSLEESWLTLHSWNVQAPCLTLSVLCLVVQSCLTLCNPMDCRPLGSSVHGDSPGKNTGVDCHALLQGIFPTPGSIPGLPHCKRILDHLSHRGGLSVLNLI